MGNGMRREFLLLILCWPLLVGVVVADPDDVAGGVERVGSGGEAYGAMYPGGSATVSFGVIVAYGTRSVGEGLVAGMVKRWLPEFIVTTGDNNYGSLDANVDEDPLVAGLQCDWEWNVGDYYGEYIQRRLDGKFPRQRSVVQRFFPSVGNHDSWPDGGTGGPIDGYVDYFASNPGGAGRLPVDRGARHDSLVSYYAVRRGPVDLFILDADVPAYPQLVREQREWLAQQVKQSGARWKLAVFHHPPVTSNAWRPGASWMAWPELAQVDAIFCGHDHFYERLIYLGKPLVICGAGGASFYGFSDPPHPASQFRLSGWSAARVAAHSQGLVIECHEAGTDGSDVVRESLSLGSVDPSDQEDVYEFFGEAGQTVEVVVEAGLGELEPVVALCAPEGGICAAGGGGAGRQAKVEEVLGETGWWKVKVTAATAGGGQYRVRVRVENPGPGYGEWSQGLAVGGPQDDPDGDGLVNLVEYALGTEAGRSDGQALEVRRTRDGVAVSFAVPSPPRPGVELSVEAAAELTGDGWFALAARGAVGDWEADPYAQVVTSGLGEGRRRVTLTVPASEERLFFRLRAREVR